MASATLNDSVSVLTTSCRTFVGESDCALGVNSIGDVRGEPGSVPSSAAEREVESAEDSPVSLDCLCDCRFAAAVRGLRLSAWRSFFALSLALASAFASADLGAIWNVCEW